MVYEIVMPLRTRVSASAGHTDLANGSGGDDGGRCGVRSSYGCVSPSASMECSIRETSGRIISSSSSGAMDCSSASQVRKIA